MSMILDIRRDMSGELSVTVAGMVHAPVVLDRGSGASVTLKPARIEHGLGWWGSVAPCRPERANGWCGELPGNYLAATEARLTVVADGVAQNVTARWPAEPAPVPEPKRRRGRKRAGHA